MRSFARKQVARWATTHHARTSGVLGRHDTFVEDHDDETMVYSVVVAVEWMADELFGYCTTVHT